MKGDWGRCLEMRLADRPGHEVEWPLLMAEMKVDFTDLKAAAYNYWVSSRLVMLWRIMTFDWFGWERLGDS